MSSGIGTFRPLKGAQPFIGEQGVIERVGEARIETVVLKKDLKRVISTIKKVHPYEEPVIDVYKLV